MLLGPEALPLLDAWQERLLAARGVADPSNLDPFAGPGRTRAEAQPMLAFLRQHVRAGTPFTFNALHLERKGGRLYPFSIPAYDGPLTISRRRYAAAQQRHLLTSIPRELRARLRLPPGWSMVAADYTACHAHIALGLCGDSTLALDLKGDFHDLTGKRLVGPCMRPPSRRAFGKVVNSAMLFGLRPKRLRQLAVAHFGPIVTARWAEQAWAAWWSHYPRLDGLAGRVHSLVQQAQAQNAALELVSPSGRVSRFSPAEVKGRVGKGRRSPPGPANVWRSVLSAIFRAVEGDLLARTLHHFQAGRLLHGGRLVLPIYDGLLVAAPAGGVPSVEGCLAAAARRATADLGLAGLKLKIDRRGP